MKRCSCHPRHHSEIVHCKGWGNQKFSPFLCVPVMAHIKTKPNHRADDSALLLFCLVRFLRSLRADLGGSDSFYASRQTRDFAGSRVVVHNAFANSALNFWLSSAQSFPCFFLIASGNSGFDLFNKSTNARFTSSVASSPLSGLPDALTRRSDIRHEFYSVQHKREG